MEIKEVKKAWSRSVNNKDYKPYKDKKYGNKVPGEVQAHHYLLYNILRGLPRERGFEPLGEGFISANAWLDFCIKYNKFKELIKPFEQTVTADELRELIK